MSQIVYGVLSLLSSFYDSFDFNIDSLNMNNLFVDFEYDNNRLQDMDSIGLGSYFSDSGAYMDIRKQLGAVDVLWSPRADLYVPEAYQLTDDEYRQFITQKEVFAYID